MFEKQLWLNRCVVFQPVHMVDTCFQSREKLVAFLGANVPCLAGEKDGNALRFHGIQRGNNAVEHLPDFPQRRLLVVERVEQAENKSSM